MDALEKPSLEERYAGAVNAGSLAPNTRRLVAVDHLGAYGMAAADLRRKRGVLTEELAGALWRAKYAGDAHAHAVARVLFGAWLLERRRHLISLDRARGQPERAPPAHDVAHDETLSDLFARRVLHEWLDEFCLACRGTGYQEIDREGRRVRPRGLGQRNARLVLCRLCAGERLARPNHGERIRALHITRADYTQHWVGSFAAARQNLVIIAQAPIAPLTAALRGRNVRA